MQGLREIVLDTETTGLSTRYGHRIIEIGCVELINRSKTGRHFHHYVNPGRSVDPSSFAIHGISDDFLKSKPNFSEIARDFLSFIDNSRIIIHNAAFDMQFINYELAPIGLPLLTHPRVIDTLLLARKKFPGSPASLDALCRRFRITLQNRDKHGALLDADLLASVYIAMHGSMQPTIPLTAGVHNQINMPHAQSSFKTDRNLCPLTESEIKAHEKLISKIDHSLWKKYANA